MAMFALRAVDKPNSLELRLATRPAHLDYWKDRMDKIVLGGPILDDEGKPAGSLMVFEVADKAEAEALVAADPYALAGLFGEVAITGWNWVLKKPE